MHPRKRPFLDFQIQITSRCNLRCPHCVRTVFAADWVDGDMSMATYRAIAAVFPQVTQVYLDAWGEPLLHPRLWAMADLARLAGCSVGITTNGTLIDGAVARQLAETMDVVGISLDGASAATYERIRPGASFDGVVSGIRELVAARRRSRRGGLPLISLLFLKQRQNIADLPAMVELAADLGVDEVIASNLTFVARPAFFSRRVYALDAPDPADEMSLERARQRARKLSVGLKLYPLSPRRVPFCEALPHRALHITWNGFVSPCVYLGLPLKTTTLTRVYEGRLLEVPVIRFGNVSTTSLTDIWDGEAYRRFREPFAGRAGRCGDVDVGITPDGGFDELDPAIFRTLSSHPLPAVCQGCYKALGI